MPRGSNLSEFEKGVAFSRHEAGETIRAIAKALNRSKSCIGDCLTRMKKDKYCIKKALSNAKN